MEEKIIYYELSPSGITSAIHSLQRRRKELNTYKKQFGKKYITCQRCKNKALKYRVRTHDFKCVSCGFNTNTIDEDFQK